MSSIRPGEYIIASPNSTPHGTTPSSVNPSVLATTKMGGKQVKIDDVKKIQDGPPCVMTGEITASDGTVYVITGIGNNEAEAREVLTKIGGEAAKVCAAAGGRAVQLSGLNFQTVHETTKQADQKAISQKLSKGEVLTPEKDETNWKLLPVGTSDLLKGELTQHKLRFYTTLDEFSKKRGRDEPLPDQLKAAFHPIATHKALFEHLDNAYKITDPQVDALLNHFKCTLPELKKILLIKPAIGLTFIDDKEIQKRKEAWAPGGVKAKKIADQLAAADKISDFTIGNPKTATGKKSFFARVKDWFRPEKQSEPPKVHPQTPPQPAPPQPQTRAKMLNQHFQEPREAAKWDKQLKQREEVVEDLLKSNKPNKVWPMTDIPQTGQLAEAKHYGYKKSIGIQGDGNCLVASFLYVLASKPDVSPQKKEEMICFLNSVKPKPPLEERWENGIAQLRLFFDSAGSKEKQKFLQRLNFEPKKYQDLMLVMRALTFYHAQSPDQQRDEELLTPSEYLSFTDLAGFAKYLGVDCPVFIPQQDGTLGLNASLQHHGVDSHDSTLESLAHKSTSAIYCDYKNNHYYVLTKH